MISVSAVARGCSELVVMPRGIERGVWFGQCARPCFMQSGAGTQSGEMMPVRNRVFCFLLRCLFSHERSFTCLFSLFFHSTLKVRRTKRLLRDLNDARASAISRRTRGDGADLPVLTAEMALKSVQEELKRVQGSIGLSHSSNGVGSRGGKAVDEACSSLVNGGAVLPRSDVVYQLVALEAEARTAAESARATVARAEARDPDHGAEAEVKGTKGVGGSVEGCKYAHMSVCTK